jgi:hypothetical protein
MHPGPLESEKEGGWARLFCLWSGRACSRVMRQVCGQKKEKIGIIYEVVYQT